MTAISYREIDRRLNARRVCGVPRAARAGHVLAVAEALRWLESCLWYDAGLDPRPGRVVRMGLVLTATRDRSYVWATFRPVKPRARRTR